MAGELPDLHAHVRTGTGKGAARQARRDGMVPGIVYGGGSDPVAINIPFNALLKRLKQGRFLSTLFNLKIDGQDDVRVICRNVQRDVVKDLPTHLDVEVKGEEECPGLKKGGVLTVVRQEVELNVLASEIPEQITVDLEGLNIGDTITISAVKLPSGSKAVIDRDFVIGNISSPSSLRSAGEDADEDDVEATEVESTEGDDNTEE